MLQLQEEQKTGKYKVLWEGKTKDFKKGGPSHKAGKERKGQKGAYTDWQEDLDDWEFWQEDELFWQSLQKAEL